MRVRLASKTDAAAIAAIYNQGIEDRVGTFETELRTEAMVRGPDLMIPIPLWSRNHP